MTEPFSAGASANEDRMDGMGSFPNALIQEPARWIFHEDMHPFVAVCLYIHRALKLLLIGFRKIFRGPLLLECHHQYITLDGSSTE